jgi:hypothetical protein
LNATVDTNEFQVVPMFVNEERTSKSENHAPTRPRVVIISGPVVQTGEYTFRFDPEYFGKDIKRQWTGITLSIEADGDENYKTAVQELNLKVPVDSKAK